MLHRWHRRVDRNGEDPGTMRNSMGLKPAQCAMLAGHYNLASELLELQQPLSSGGSENRRRRRRTSASRRRTAEGGSSGGAGSRGSGGGGGGGDLTRDVMLSMMHRAKLLVQLQSLADEERRGMAVLRQRLELGDVGGGGNGSGNDAQNDDQVLSAFVAASAAVSEAQQAQQGGGNGGAGGGHAGGNAGRTRSSRRGGRSAGGENTELQLLRNTINALQEALQVGAVPLGGGGGGGGGGGARGSDAGVRGGVLYQWCVISVVFYISGVVMLLHMCTHDMQYLCTST